MHIIHPQWLLQFAEWWQRNHRRIVASSVSADDSGFTAIISFDDGSETKTKLGWHDVNEVVAYKCDFIYVDRICLGFSSQDGGVEVHEEMQGWDDFIEGLPKHLPGMPYCDVWWRKVAVPAFATNAMTLFSR